MKKPIEKYLNLPDDFTAIFCYFPDPEPYSGYGSGRPSNTVPYGSNKESNQKHYSETSFTSKGQGNLKILVDLIFSRVVTLSL